MNKLIQLILTTFLVGPGLLPAELQAQPVLTGSRYRPDQILVKPKTSINGLTEIHGRVGVQVRKTFSRFGGLQIVTLPPRSERRSIARGV